MISERKCGRAWRNESYDVAPLDKGTVEALKQVPRTAVPDMPDRIIAATAYQLGLPLITRDSKIKESKIMQVIW
jgi:PIN domain nuclease of toxin-antitoxin system